MTITIDDVANLPELDFGSTRRIGTPVEVGLIAPLRGIPGLVKFEPEELIFGFYKDAKSGMHYLIHSTSLHPSGGFPEASRLDQIHKYVKVRDYKR